MATGPQQLQFQAVHDRLPHFQNDLVPGAHQLGRDINPPAAQRGGLAAQGQDVLQAILCEGLVAEIDAIDFFVLGVLDDVAGTGSLVDSDVNATRSSG
ncbi:MAG TPA: hypothetical protein VN901_26230 [Candidatus Acidoferrales bacterium]|nr:hypothetical protein [Candidatus Acidoferrales bacterium]